MIFKKKEDKRPLRQGDIEAIVRNIQLRRELEFAKFIDEAQAYKYILEIYGKEAADDWLSNRI